MKKLQKRNISFLMVPLTNNLRNNLHYSVTCGWTQCLAFDYIQVSVRSIQFTIFKRQEWERCKIIT